MPKFFMIWPNSLLLILPLPSLSNILKTSWSTAIWSSLIDSEKKYGKISKFDEKNFPKSLYKKQISQKMSLKKFLEVSNKLLIWKFDLVMGRSKFDFRGMSCLMVEIFSKMLTWPWSRSVFHFDFLWHNGIVCLFILHNSKTENPKESVINSWDRIRYHTKCWMMPLIGICVIG